MTLLVILLSLATAVCFAASYVLQYHEAHEAPQRLFRSPIKMLVELAHHRLWLAGLIVMFVGDGLQAAALAVGSLAVVEPFLTLALLFALPLSAAWRRERVRRQEWIAASCVSAGLGILLSVGSPTVGRASMPGTLWLLVVLASCGGAALAVSYGRRAASPRTRASLLGASAGILFGLQDVLTHYCLAQMSHNFFGLMFAWQPYLSIVVGVYGIALMQAAYKAGPLSSALPTIAVGEPVVGMLIGVFALNERLNQASWALAIEATAALVMVIGTWQLGRSPLVLGKHHPSRLRQLEASLETRLKPVVEAAAEATRPSRLARPKLAMLNALSIWTVIRRH